MTAPSEAQKLRDIEVITQLADTCPALRRHLSHHLKNDAMMLVQAELDNDWTIVRQYCDMLKHRLAKVGL